MPQTVAYSLAGICTVKHGITINAPPAAAGECVAGLHRDDTPIFADLTCSRAAIRESKSAVASLAFLLSNGIAH
jgi:hypothetical protein